MRQYLQPNEVTHVTPKWLVVSASIVSRAWWRYQETAHHTRRAGQACRRATAEEEDQYLCARRNSKNSVTALQNDLQQVVRNCPKQNQ